MGELMPTLKDLEREGAEDKIEIHYEQRAQLEITIYYLRKLGSVSMELFIEGLPMREFEIPPEEVNEAIAHPEAYAARQGMFREVPRGSEE